MKLLVIFNPSASHGRSAGKLASIRSRFDSLGIRADILPTTHPGHGSELVANADIAAYDGLIAAGGDGTVFEVLNGMYRHPRAARIPLGLLPIGTGNAFARDLGLAPAAWREAIDLIHRGQTRSVDVGRVSADDTAYYFLNIVHMGLSVDANRTAQKLKFLGNSAYTLATLWQVLWLGSYPMELEIDGEPLVDDNVFVAISNTRYTGTHFMMAPKAVIDDGLLDLTILTRLSRRRILKLFPTIYDGGHVDYTEVTTRKASTITIHSPAAKLLAPDGEFIGRTPAEISCLHRDLEIFV